MGSSDKAGKQTQKRKSFSVEEVLIARRWKIVEINKDQGQGQAKTGQDDLQGNEDLEFARPALWIIRKNETPPSEPHHEKCQEQTHFIVEVAEKYLKCQDDKDFEGNASEAEKGYSVKHPNGRGL